MVCSGLLNLAFKIAAESVSQEAAWERRVVACLPACVFRQACHVHQVLTGLSLVELYIQ